MFFKNICGVQVEQQWLQIAKMTGYGKNLVNKKLFLCARSETCQKKLKRSVKQSE